jgi:tRNA A-37 threonylcarbamoyl transferase component Bud32
MITASRECPSCKASLPADAIFCHKCGAATSFTADPSLRSTPVDHVDAAELAQRAAVQRALGETYEVRRLLGRGGFAEVYVAYDKRLKREIAVKTIRGDLVVNEMLLDRFQREAEAVAKLRHPNVIPIYSVGEEGGLAFFTMPLVEGESLATVIEREGRVAVPEAIRILREASNALHAAHRVGIVHRDIKPENIMLEGPERSAVVMDFGIAKSDASGGKGLTGTGMLVGTPDYMSPEQAMGEGTLDGRSDQYSLAMVGFRMVTGRVPFTGDSAQTLLFKTVTEVPPPASEIAPDVPIALSEVLSKALSKRPEDRFESMAAFAAALTRVEQAGQDGASSRERRRLDLATRIREMQATIPALRRAAAIALVGVIATVIFLAVGSPGVPFVVAPLRDDAVFAAKTFLASHGAASQRSEFTTFVAEDSVYRFLREQLGREGAEQRALADMPSWQWTVRSLSGVDRSEWYVVVGPSGRPSGYRRTISDTLPGPRISIDSARILATKELAALGLDVARIRPLSDSTMPRKARTDYVFRWSLPTKPIRWQNDSAYSRVSVTIAGDKVVRVTPLVRLPDRYRNPSRASLAGVYVLIFFFGAVGAIVGIVRRQQVDELQWRVMTRLAAFVAAVFVVELAVKLPETVAAVRAGVGTQLSQLLTLGIGFLIVAGGAVCVAVAGESLTYRHKPNVSAGLAELVRGRLIIPELVTSSAYGYALAATLALVTALLVWTSQVLGFGTPIFPVLPFAEHPLMETISASIVGGVALPVATLLVFGVTGSIRYLSKAALFVPAALTAAVYLFAGSAATTTLTATVTVFIITYALSRHGLLTALLTMMLAMQLERMIPLLRAGDAHDLLHGTGVLVLFLAPAALAVAAYRRFAITPRGGGRGATTGGA